MGCLGHLRITSDGQVEVDWNILHVGDQRIVGAAAISSQSVAELEARLSAQYRDFVSVFEPQMADALPPHRTFDHAIDLQEETKPPWGPIYALSEKELTALREYLDEILRTGKIRASKSPAGAPILFVPKSHGRGLRICVDYRGLNRITILNR